MPYFCILRMSEYVEELLAFNPNYDRTLLELAYETAKKMHKDQKRRSGEPYIIHPMAVGKILAELGMDDHCIAAGLLHDAVEDTEYSLDDCRRDFGEDIAVMVDGVTKLTNIEYTSKEDAQAENVRKMFMAMSKDIRVLVIKLADRLHNMRTIEYQTPEKQVEKSKETLEIYAPIASRLGIYKFKFELEDISFKILEPEAYRNIENELKKRQTSRSEQIETLMKQVEEVIQGLDIKYEITGRRKHYYSIYKKMIYQHKEIDEIFDLTAIRVIVESVKDCYAVLGAVHTKWTPIPGRFKDYVAMPKSNHYQSLHTTVLSSKGTPFEIQIRTQEMHRVAEYGIAAHWKYKEGITDKSNEDEIKLAWIRQTLEWQYDMNDSKEFIDTLKVDLFSNQVFVFTPKGDVMELPAGSTPLDFAFRVHTFVGLHCVGAKVNGKMVSKDYVLQNGEIVDIVTNPNSPGPTIEWLKIVKTNSAKNKIRQYLKKINKDLDPAKGKEVLERAAKHKDLDIEKVLKPQFVSRAARAQQFTSSDDLYSSLAGGGSVINKTLMLCLSYFREEEQAELKRQERFLKKQEQLAKRPDAKNAGVSIEGISDLLIHYAKCCSPVPGDEIVGYTTKGRGISIHRKDCVNMLSLPENELGRLINVEWDLKKDKMTFNASITILAEDKKGLLAEVSRLCEEMDINMTYANVKVDKSSLCTMNLTLAISNTDDIEKIMARMKQIKGVIDVYRSSY